MEKLISEMILGIGGFIFLLFLYKWNKNKLDNQLKPLEETNVIPL